MDATKQTRLQADTLHAINIFTERILDNQNKLMVDPLYFNTFVITQINLQLELLNSINTIHRHEPAGT